MSENQRNNTQIKPMVLLARRLCQRRKPMPWLRLLNL